jgi:hypothetical protein
MIGSWKARFNKYKIHREDGRGGFSARIKATRYFNIIMIKAKNLFTRPGGIISPSFFG